MLDALESFLEVPIGPIPEPHLMITPQPPPCVRGPTTSSRPRVRDRADGLHPQRQRPGGLHPHGYLRLGRQHPRHAGEHELPPCCGLWPSGHRPAPFLQGRQPLHHEPL
ncbi:hypothetical protein OJ253_134 [Cryptosporidium canis]|uniref:Uncharacterized protein n=1 Tax=Cryptosporidium canis TaxID=195482 RepID=A0A9D5DP09_9CRYT|nr:hypothetical protein OJ253_134 [Cryptosporidium canis]